MQKSDSPSHVTQLARQALVVGEVHPRLTPLAPVLVPVNAELLDLARPVDGCNVLANTLDTPTVLVPHALVRESTVRGVEVDEAVRALDAGHPVCLGALVADATQPVLKDALLATVPAPDIVARPAPLAYRSAHDTHIPLSMNASSPHATAPLFVENAANSSFPSHASPTSVALCQMRHGRTPRPSGRMVTRLPHAGRLVRL